MKLRKDGATHFIDWERMAYPPLSPITKKPLRWTFTFERDIMGANANDLRKRCQ